MRRTPLPPDAEQPEPCEGVRSFDERELAGFLLGRLMRSRCLPPRDVRRVCNPGDLPVRLQRIVCLISMGEVWRAYTDGKQWWFAVSNATRHDSYACVLNVGFFSYDGVLCGAGSWRFSRIAGFVLTGIFEVGAGFHWTPSQAELRAN